MDKGDFASRTPQMIGESRFKKYAVLVPIIESASGRSLIFEKRAGSLRRQPGEICFPGGMLEPDELPQVCAIRETTEELRIDAQQISILGPGDIFVSPFDIIIYPFIGEIYDYRHTYNPDEVSEVIDVPIDFFLKNSPEKYRSTIVSKLPGDFPYERIPGGENYAWGTGTHDVLFYQHNHHLIWGITAHIVRSAAKLIDQYHLS